MNHSTLLEALRDYARDLRKQADTGAGAMEAARIEQALSERLADVRAAEERSRRRRRKVVSTQGTDAA